MMGCDYRLSCKTCKKTYCLGSGSYSGWLTVMPDLSRQVETVADYDAAAAANPDCAEFYGNQNLRRVLAEHEGHDLELWSSDWMYENECGDLVMDHGYKGEEVCVSGHKRFEHINLEPRRIIFNGDSVEIEW